MSAEEAKTVIIENIDDLSSITHKCTSQELLTEIRICQARTEETLSSLVTRFEAYTNTGHECKYKDQIDKNTDACEYLKEQIHKMQGQSKWEDRLWNIGQSVLIAALVAVVLFFMKGGNIT